MKLLKNKNIRFISFANDIMYGALERIGREAEMSGYFTDVMLFTDKKFDKEYYEKYGYIYEKYKRGYGYWVWKTYILKKALEDLREGDYIVYLDSGCEIQSGNEAKFKEYLHEADTCDLGLVCFSVPFTSGRQYTKMDLIDYCNRTFGCQENMNGFLSTEQIMAGLLVIRKNKNVIEFLDKWYDVMHHHIELFDDTPSKLPNYEGFIESRHDQSVFSLLIKIYGGAIIHSGFEVEAIVDKNRVWRKKKDFPFIATRNRTGKPRLPYKGVRRTLLNLLYDIENALIDAVHAIRS